MQTLQTAGGKVLRGALLCRGAGHTSPRLSLCTLAPLGHLHPPLPSRRELGGCQGPANMQFLRPQSKEDTISLGRFIPRDKLVFVAVVFPKIHHQ